MTSQRKFLELQRLGRPPKYEEKKMTGYEVFEYLTKMEKETGRKLAFEFYVIDERNRFDGRHEFFIQASTVDGRRILENPFWLADRFFLSETFQKLRK